MRVVDPQGKAEGEALLPGVEWAEDPYEAAKDADAVVLLTEWNEFRALNLEELAGAMKTARMVDLRNIYAESKALKSGFESYVGVGR